MVTYHCQKNSGNLLLAEEQWQLTAGRRTEATYHPATICQMTATAVVPLSQCDIPNITLSQHLLHHTNGVPSHLDIVLMKSSPFYLDVVYFSTGGYKFNILFESTFTGKSQLDYRSMINFQTHQLLTKSFILFRFIFVL